MQRSDGRAADQLREISFEIDFTKHAEGSVLVRSGDTHVLCNATLEEGVPPWMRDQQSGWVTGEYAMLPRATHTRNRRETKGKSGRTQEISRLIGRSLRAAFNLEALGEVTCTVDCDVLQADGGTRTASITGGYLAAAIAFKRELSGREGIFRAPVAATSVGVVKGVPVLDLCYVEDSTADSDVNFVMNGDGGLIEVQGTAENEAFSKEEFSSLLVLAEKGVRELIAKQQEILEHIG